jgi:hypothetical protein
MKPFNEFVNESSDAKTADDLVAAIETSFKKYFKDSYINVKFTTNLGASIYVAFALGKDKSEWNNSIFENDPFAIKMHVFGLKKDGTFGPKLEVEGGGGISIKDPTGRFHSQTVKVFRKFSGDYAKIVKGFDNYFKKMHTATKENLEGVQGLVDFDVAKKL